MLNWLEFHRWQKFDWVWNWNSIKGKWDFLDYYAIVHPKNCLYNKVIEIKIFNGKIVEIKCSKLFLNQIIGSVQKRKDFEEDTR